MMNGATFALSLLGANADAARDQRIHFLGDRPTVSGSPTDGQPDLECLEARRLAARLHMLLHHPAVAFRAARRDGMEDCLTHRSKGC